jgi:hypothetical protein
MKKTPKKVLVILPSDDVRRIEDQVSEGKYVTKSDFLRIAVKQLLYGIGGAEKYTAKYLHSGKASVLNSEEVLAALKANKAKIHKLGVKEIGLFGSYARNEQTPESDIDVLVEFSEGRKSFHAYMQLKLFLERIFKKKVDLVIKEAIRPELKRSILEGVVYA